MYLFPVEHGDFPECHVIVFRGVVKRSKTHTPRRKLTGSNTPPGNKDEIQLSASHWGWPLLFRKWTRGVCPCKTIGILWAMKDGECANGFKDAFFLYSNFLHSNKRSGNSSRSWNEKSLGYANQLQFLGASLGGSQQVATNALPETNIVSEKWMVRRLLYFCGRPIFRCKLLVLVSVTSPVKGLQARWELATPPPEIMALWRAYENPLISLNKAFLNRNFGGGAILLNGVTPTNLPKHFDKFHPFLGEYPRPGSSQILLDTSWKSKGTTPPPNATTPRNSRPYEGILNHHHPLIRPYVWPYFLWGCLRFPWKQSSPFTDLIHTHLGLQDFL